VTLTKSAFTALCLVGGAFFVFLMFKVPAYGAYKLTAATIGVVRNCILALTLLLFAKNFK